MSRACLDFKQLTLENIESFTLQEALMKVGWLRYMSEQQLKQCEWKIHFLKQRINSLQKQKESDRLQQQKEIVRLKRQNEIVRLKRQNEILQAKQKITKLQEQYQKLQKIISDQEGLRNRHEQAIASRVQEVLRKQLAILFPETSFYLKDQFLVGFGAGLFGIIISLALGWIGIDENGFSKLLVGIIAGGIYAIIWIIFLFCRVYHECQKKKKLQKLNTKQIQEMEERKSSREQREKTRLHEQILVEQYNQTQLELQKRQV